jgi:hypothetical protein
MHRFLLPAAGAALALALPGGCADTTSRAAGAPTENFDPAQVRMLPDNPYRPATPERASTTKLP